MFQKFEIDIIMHITNKIYYVDSILQLGVNNMFLFQSLTRQQQTNEPEKGHKINEMVETHSDPMITLIRFVILVS